MYCFLQLLVAVAVPALHHELVGDHFHRAGGRRGHPRRLRGRVRPGAGDGRRRGQNGTEREGRGTAEAPPHEKPAAPPAGRAETAGERGGRGPGKLRGLPAALGHPTWVGAVGSAERQHLVAHDSLGPRPVH